MAFLDIERVINQERVGSRFKLVYLAGLRAKELNNPIETTVLADIKHGDKVTSKALTDIVRNRITFEKIDETEQENAEVSGEPEE